MYYFGFLGFVLCLKNSCNRTRKTSASRNIHTYVSKGHDRFLHATPLSHHVICMRKKGVV